MAKEVSLCSEEEAYDLLDQLERILDHDPLIDEVGFIHPSHLLVLNKEADATPVSSDIQELDARMSPEPSKCDAPKGKKAFFWNKDHKLGVSTAYLLPLYKAAKHKFMEALAIYKMHSGPSFMNENLPGNIVFSKVENEVMKHSRALLLLSSDFGTAWNARKAVISNKEDFSHSVELLVSALVLSFAPKSENAWSHRRWVIKRIASRCDTLEEILDKESKLVEKIAEKSKMNYRAWNHRCWLISYMSSRQKLTLQMLADASEQQDAVACSSQLRSVRKFWKDEFDWNEMLIRRYIGREALWLHRRFLSVGWVKHFGANEQNPNGEGEVNNHVKVFMDYELSLLQDCLNIPESEFEDVQSQVIHAASYMLRLNWEICSSLSINLNQERRISDLGELLKRLCPENSIVWDHLTTNLY